MKKQQVVFHPSLEGAQHGSKSLGDFIYFAQNHGAKGAQPSNFHLEDPESDKFFKPAIIIKTEFSARGISLDGVSAHCPFWVYLSAWTGTPTIRPFLPSKLHHASVQEIEKWERDYIFQLFDLLAELGVKTIPMFWGPVYGLEVTGGYPWGLWEGPGYDLLAEGDERFVRMTQEIRDRARERGIMLCHEIHPGTAAMCVDDFERLLYITDDDIVMQVMADPSHCWEGESWQDRFSALGEKVCGCHVKDHRVKAGHPLRSMIPDWKNRGMEFTPLGQGQIDLVEYAELLIKVGYPQRYCETNGTKTAPLVVEAEAAVQDLDFVSAQGIKYVAEHCCFPVASGSFEKGMGVQE